MNFRTELPKASYPFRIHYRSQVLMVGSCFSEHIAYKMRQLRFAVENNPTGIVFNPISVAQTLDRCLTTSRYEASDLFWANELWNSFHHHSSFSGPDKDATLYSMNQALDRAAETLQHAQVLFLTFGTAYAYRHLATEQVVANNHKLPNTQFHRFRLEVADVVRRYTDLIGRLHTHNPNMHVVFTVSPVRHIADGLHENQLSKAILLLAIDQLCKTFDFCYYFPAYEAFIDDLRDYRFYADDLTHPAPQGIEYVWEHFQTAFIEPDALALSKTVSSIYRAMEHKVRNPQSDAHRRFLGQQAEKVLRLMEEFPFLDLSDARAYFDRQ